MMAAKTEVKKKTEAPETIEMESDEDLQKHTTGNDGPSWQKSYTSQ